MKQKRLGSLLCVLTCATIASAACTAADDSSPGASIDAGTSTKDAIATGDAVAGSCLPGDVTSFVGGDYHPPSGAYQGVCDSDSIEYYVECKRDTNASACNQLASGAGLDCLKCIETPSSAQAWGPVVVSGTNGYLNLAGCLALAYGEGTSSTGCGGTLQKELNCEIAACGTNCANATSGDLESCELASIASSGGCSAFSAATGVACTNDGGAAVDACFQQTYPDGGISEDTYAYAARLAAYFCGFGTADAGGLGDGG